MDLQTVFVFIVYAGLALSLGVYGYRLYRRVVHHETRADRAAARAAGTGATGSTGAETAIGAPTSSSSRRNLPTTSGPAAPGTAPAQGSLVEQVIREELAARGETDAADGGPAGPAGPDGVVDSAPGTGPAEPPSLRGGYFVAAEQPTTSRPVGELVAGITMPCDLSPLVDADGSIDSYRVAFITRGHPPTRVGAAVADELERLGFTLRTDSDTELVARRDHDTLRVTLYPEASNERRDATRLFPTATPGSIVVVFES